MIAIIIKWQCKIIVMIIIIYNDPFIYLHIYSCGVYNNMEQKYEWANSAPDSSNSKLHSSLYKKYVYGVPMYYIY